MNCNLCKKDHPSDKNKYCSLCGICCKNNILISCPFHKQKYIINTNIILKDDDDDIDDDIFYKCITYDFNPNIKYSSKPSEDELTYNIECTKTSLKKEIINKPIVKKKWYQKLF